MTFGTHELENLIREIQVPHGVEILSNELAKLVIERVAHYHVRDASSIYWWANLKEVCEEAAYQESADGLAVLSGMLQSIEGEEAYLVFTDDQPPPWVALKVHVENLRSVIESLPFVEYFIASRDFRTTIFDTHENKLVLSRNSD